MTRHYPPALIAVAVALTMLAGFVDAVVFTRLGFFASFMSGNTTRLGSGLAGEGIGFAATAALLIASFVTGVVMASLVAQRWARVRKVAVMTLVTALLVAAALLEPAGRAGIPLLAAAMGAANGVFMRDGEVAIGVTYFTGALVRGGQRLAGALTGQAPRWAWASHFALWLGFLGGVVAGVAAERSLTVPALWIAAGVAGVLTLTVARIAPAGA